MPIRLARLVLAAMLPLLYIASPVSASEPGMLNARGFGASGSKFETTASTTAGSNEMTVKDVGDFKVNQ